MSRENVDLVRRLAEAFKRGNLDAVRPFLDPALVWHEDPSFPEAGVYRGLGEWEAYARQFLAEVSEITYEPGEAIDAGRRPLGKRAHPGARQSQRS